MHLPLFKALKTLNLDDDRATEIVTAFEEHINMKVSEANAELRADIGALRAEIQSMKWLFVSFGTLIALTGLAPNIAKLFH